VHEIKDEDIMNRTHIAFLLLMLSLPFMSGCALLLAGGAGAAGAGTGVYVKGDLETNLEAPLERTIEATNRAIDNLEFVKISEEADKLTGEITARTAQDKKIKIKLDKVTDNTTKISIRVGVFGDKALSYSLLEEIKKGVTKRG
jgi:hypothetical protein